MSKGSNTFVLDYKVTNSQHFLIPRWHRQLTQNDPSEKSAKHAIKNVQPKISNFGSLLMDDGSVAKGLGDVLRGSSSFFFLSQWWLSWGRGWKNNKPRIYNMRAFFYIGVPPKLPPKRKCAGLTREGVMKGNDGWNFLCLLSHILRADAGGFPVKARWRFT